MKTKIQEGTETFSFTVGTRALSQALNILSKAVAANPVLPIIENVKAEIIKGELTLRATNLSLTLIKKIDCFAGESGMIEDGSALIPFKLMSDLIKTLPDTPIVILHEKKYENGTYVCKITVKVDGKKFGISTEHDVDFPKIPLVDGEIIAIKDTDLREALTTCLVTVAEDELRPAMCGVHFDTRWDKLKIVSCSGHCMSVIETEVTISEDIQKQDSFTMGTKTAEAIKANISADGSNVEIIKSARFVKVETNHCTIIGQLIEDRYVDYLNAIPTNAVHTTNLFAPEWRNELKRANIFANQTTKAVKHIFGEGHLELRSEDLDYGNESIQQIDTDSDIECTIGFNGGLLSALLQGVPGQARVDIWAANRAMLIWPENKSGQTSMLLAMPVFLNTPQ